MTDAPFSVVTGAFGYTGKYIARRLLARGERVATLTGNPNRPSEFGARVPAIPLRFDDPDALAARLRGSHTLYNTYWVRFDRGRQTHDSAVANTRALIRAAESAGVRRIVHLSVTNPSPSSPLPYFRGKALLEEAIRQSRLSYAILRPTLIFGREDILINNIAFLLRRLPVFAIPGSGAYRLQPIYVEDLAELAADAGVSDDNMVADATGPEIFSFEELVRSIARAIGSRARIVHVPPAIALVALKILGLLLNDVVLTRDELEGLMDNLLVTSAPPSGRTRFTDWLKENAGVVGRAYASELARHFR